MERTHTHYIWSTQSRDVPLSSLAVTLATGPLTSPGRRSPKGCLLLFLVALVDLVSQTACNPGANKKTQSRRDAAKPQTMNTRVVSTLHTGPRSQACSLEWRLPCHLTACYAVLQGFHVYWESFKSDYNCSNNLEWKMSKRFSFSLEKEYLCFVTISKFQLQLPAAQLLGGSRH